MIILWVCCKVAQTIMLIEYNNNSKDKTFWEVCNETETISRENASGVKYSYYVKRFAAVWSVT